MRVAFSIHEGHQWSGGVNYITNLITALTESSLPGLEIFFFLHEKMGDEQVAAMELNSSVNVVHVKKIDRIETATRKLFTSFISFFYDSKSAKLYKEHNIDVVYVVGKWYGFYFPIRRISWIPDFQHIQLKKMFTLTTRIKRTIGYHLLTVFSKKIVVSSFDAHATLINNFPFARGKSVVLPFAVAPYNITQTGSAFDKIKSKYSLPDKYLFLPNQFWKHKNHISVLMAIKKIIDRGSSIKVVATGAASDYRNPDYPASIISYISENKLEPYFIYLGTVAYNEIPLLMSNSIGLINPSYFEGWSTTVEEAKSAGVNLILSDIPVHREQCGSLAVYFDPGDIPEISTILEKYYNEINLKEYSETKASRQLNYFRNRSEFAKKSLTIFL